MSMIFFIVVRVSANYTLRRSTLSLKGREFVDYLNSIREREGGSVRTCVYIRVPVVVLNMCMCTYMDMERKSKLPSFLSLLLQEQKIIDYH